MIPLSYSSPRDSATYLIEAKSRGAHPSRAVWTINTEWSDAFFSTIIRTAFSASFV